MLYQTFIHKAKELTVSQAEESGVWYLEPEWQDIMHRNGLGDLEDLTDSYIADWLDVENILELEVKKRNAQNSKKQAVINWLYDTITSTVEPAMLQEETEYMKNLVEYMKTKPAAE